MAKKKRASGQEIKELRSNLSKLKKLGLWSGDARSAKGGWRQKQTVKEFRDVLSGRATVVKPPKVKAKESRSRVRETLKNVPLHSRQAIGSVRRKGNVLIAPVRQAGEKIKLNAKTGQIESHVTFKRGNRQIRHKRILHGGKIASADNLPQAPEGQKYWYSIMNRKGSGFRYDNIEQLKEHIARYKKPEESYEENEAKMMQYIEILVEDEE